MDSRSQIRILDTTLRDGEQAPGVALSVAEKVFLATELAKTGVAELEIGSGGMGGMELEAIREIISLGLPVRAFTWNRVHSKDIGLSLSAGVKNMFISAPVSLTHIRDIMRKSPEEVLRQVGEMIRYATNEGVYVAQGLIDASRADDTFMKEMIHAGESAGAKRFRVSDTAGLLSPERTSELIRNVKSITNCTIEFHAHNDFGLALANTLSAISAGAEIVDTTLLGVGERSGNVSLDQLVMALDHGPANPHGDTDGHTGAGSETEARSVGNMDQIIRLSKAFAEMIHYDIAPDRPFLGSRIFSHESGVHADGIKKDPASYQPYDPSITGHEHKIVPGKHTGSGSILMIIREKYPRAKKEDAESIIEALREHSVNKKRELTNEEVIRIYEKRIAGEDNHEGSICNKRRRHAERTFRLGKAIRHI